MPCSLFTLSQYFLPHCNTLAKTLDSNNRAHLTRVADPDPDVLVGSSFQNEVESGSGFQILSDPDCIDFHVERKTVKVESFYTVKNR